MRTWLVAIMMALASASASAADIRVMAAGSLKDAFTAIFADYTKQYGAGFAPVWGPSGMLARALAKGRGVRRVRFRRLAACAGPDRCRRIRPERAVRANALCVVTTADSALDSGNLVETLLKPEIKIGTSTPVSDPAGDYTWEMFRKVDALRPGAFETLSKKAQQLFGGPATRRRSTGARGCWSRSTTTRSISSSIIARARADRPGVGQYKSVALPPELRSAPNTA